MKPLTYPGSSIAIQVPPSADFARSAAGLDPTRSYAIYCRSGNRSKAAMAALNQTGFSHLFDLAGGIGAWQSAGGEVVTN